eukprot:CAMPEP_0168324518 /NCGR_PEP_ID=MMETSP0213-20121227/4135_1 /TAXON_ID=151035 /ORGANISM="Euplotes harpa, Strain FSP1.4" /LENGTH=618 /DNA_ID=CAMNT_0008326817 /DNA_START=6 /DNA_END=1866 /DNA_ORIENTATION=+
MSEDSNIEQLKEQMSEDSNIEQLKEQISKLENNVATLTGENSRLNSEIKRMTTMQHSLDPQPEASAKPSADVEELKDALDRKDQQIADLQEKLKHYKGFEASRLSMEAQLNEIQIKADNYLRELTATKASHELEVKELKAKLKMLAAGADGSDELNSGYGQLVQLNINLIACEDAEDNEFARDEASTKEMSDKNAKLKKKLIQEMKLTNKLTEEMEAMKTDLFGLQSKNDEIYQQNSEEFQKMRDEIIQKAHVIDQLENTNRQLEVRTKKAEGEAREALLELQQIQDQNEERDDKFGDQDEQIAQMHEDMQRLLEFKNELEALIEEQNKDIEDKTKKLNSLLGEINHKNDEIANMSGYIKNLEKQNKEMKTKLNQLTLKLNQLKQGKIAELQKKIKELTSEADILKEMVKSSKNEIRSKEISIKKYQKRLMSLERISKIRSKASEIYSNHSQTSHRNRSIGRHNESYDDARAHEIPDDDEETDEVIVEAEENLEETGKHDPRIEYGQQLVGVQFSKTPNIRISKHLNNSKISNVMKDSSEKLKQDNSTTKVDRDIFSNKSKKGYFYSDQNSFVLPAIKDSQGAIIFDRKKLDMLMKDIDDTKTTAKISNTYKQSYNIY